MEGEYKEKRGIYTVSNANAVKGMGRNLKFVKGQWGSASTFV